MAKKVTMDEIAKELSLSKSLVSRAINDKYGVNDETRSRIKLAALKLGYNFAAKAKVTPGKAESITLVIERHDLTDVGFWVRIVNGIEKSLNTQGISVFLSILESGDDEFVPLSIKQMKTDGVIFLGQIPLQIVLSIASSGLPVILVDSDYPNLKFDYVTANNYVGCHEAAEYLIQEGHRKIGFIGSVKYSYSFSERFRGFADCVREAGCSDPALFSVTDAHDSLDIPFSTRKLRALAKSGPLPTAFVCGNDITALYAYEILQEAGIRIPDEVSVIGFDNIQRCEWAAPTLTSVDIPKEQIGSMIVDILLRRVKEPDRASEQVLVGTMIVKRNSVQRVGRDNNKLQ